VNAFTGLIPKDDAAHSGDLSVINVFAMALISAISYPYQSDYLLYRVLLVKFYRKLFSNAK